MSSPRKFRVWSDELKQWITHCVMLSPDGVVFTHSVAVHDDGQIEHRINLAEPLKPVVEQFTGLQDDDGKDIYENDLIRHANAKISCVFWRGDETASWPVGWASSHLNESVRSCVVAGNIHENPELIPAK